MNCEPSVIVSSPYAVTIFSVFLTATATLVIEKWISYRKYTENRKAQLRILKSFFAVARGQLLEIQKMDVTQIHSHVNTTVVLTLLRGEYLTPKKDEKLIMLLNKYIFDTEQINRVFAKVDIGLGGFTTGQVSNATITMENLKNVVPEFLKLLDRCVAEVESKL